MTWVGFVIANGSQLPPAVDARIQSLGQEVQLPQSSELLEVLSIIHCAALHTTLCNTGQESLLCFRRSFHAVVRVDEPVLEALLG